MPRNYTIDDSQWSTPPLTLSAGWNMLRLGGSNEYIDEQSTSLMTPLLPNFWNQSVSWTTTADASTTLNFIGTDIWAYGMAGPEQGAYKAVLDGKEIGKYTANTPKANYNSLLFAAHELQDGIVHRLQLVNDQAGASLAFDMALITTSTEDISLPPIVPSQTSATASTASAAPGSSILPADDTGSLFNHTSGGLEGIAQAAGVPPNLIPTQYTKEQLSLLHTKYEFHWNGAAYFVVVFSCIVSALFVALVIRMIAQSLSERKKRARRARDGESYLITGKRPRPTTRIVEALKGKKISNPMPSENGHSVRTGTDRRDSEGTGATYIDNDVAKGW